MPAPALPDLRVMDETFTNYRDFSVANDTGGGLLKLADCGWLQAGQARGGRYDLSVVPGSLNAGANTCTIRRKVRSIDNPTEYCTTNSDHDTDITGVLLDGTTPYEGTIVPDAYLVFALEDTAGTQETWTAHVTIGDYIGAFEEGNPGGATPGDPVESVRLGLKNTGSTIKKQVTLYNDKPRVENRIRAGLGIFAKIRVDSDDAVEKEEGGTLRTLPYKCTIENTSGSTFDLKVDAALVTTMRRLGVSPTTTGDSTGLEMGEWYRFESGGLNGIAVLFRTDIDDSVRCNLIVQDPLGNAISADDGGEADEFLIGEVNTGDYDPGDGVNWHVQFDANLGSGNKNPYQVDVGIRWLETGTTAADED